MPPPPRKRLTPARAALLAVEQEALAHELFRARDVGGIRNGRGRCGR